MIPIMKLRYFMQQKPGSSGNEASLHVPSTSSDNSNSLVEPTPLVDSTTSVDSTSASNSISANDSVSADDSAVPVPSTSPERAVDLTSPTPSTSSASQISPVQMSPVPSTSRGIQANSDDFRFEAARRSSFQNWTVSSVDPANLATAGFYYTGCLNRVKCFECQLQICHWSGGLTPMQIHEMCSPECRFVRNEHCDNVPIGADPDIILRKKRKNRNLYGPYGLQYQESFDFNDHRFLRYLRNPTAYELSRLGLKTVKKPENTGYASYESRLNSFVTWPTYMTQKSEELADAGFYYTGINDFTTCYHCGIGIGNWRPDEDPWEQHAISSPTCSYLLTVRGWEYVNNVTGQKLYETSAEASIQMTDGTDATSNSENEINDMTLVQKIAALEKENRTLKNARSCKVCTEREATITFLPCGHLATCHYCSPAFAQCIVCRKEIKAVTRTFLT